MRIHRFSLIRYGHFADRDLHFPQPKKGLSDLHLVVGANETGKSTFRSALTDFLFGIPQQSPFNFRYNYREMLLEACLGNSDVEDIFQRRKGLKNTLRRSDDRIADPSELARHLHGLSREAFERQYALDHQALVDGGQRLVTNRSDLSGLLFEAASGLADMTARQRELADSAEALWRRGRRKSDYRDVYETYQSARKHRDQVMVRAPVYQKLQHDLKEAERAQEAAREKVDMLDRESAALHRLRRTATSMANLDQLEADIDRLKQSLKRRLPRGTLGKLIEWRTRHSTIQSEITRRGQNCTDIKSRQARLSPDREILDSADDIQALGKMAARVENYPQEINLLQGERTAKQRRASRFAVEIGWKDVAADSGALEKYLPSALQRKALQTLIRQYDVLAQEKVRTAHTVTAKARQQEKLTNAIQEIPAAVDLTPLRQALAGARGIGDEEHQRQSLTAQRDSAAQELAAAQGTLSPWSGTLAALEAIRLPQASVVARFQSDMDAAVEQRRVAAADIQDKDARLREKSAVFENLHKQYAVVDAATVAAARETRDSLWGKIKSGEIVLDGISDPLTPHIHTADELADSRFTAANAVVEAAQLSKDMALLEVQKSNAADQLQAASDRIAEIEDDWRRLTADSGLQGLMPEDIAVWQSARAQTLAAAQRLATADHALTAFDNRVTEAHTALVAALESIACLTALRGEKAADDLACLAFQPLTDAAAAIYQEMEEAQHTRKNMQRQYDDGHAEFLELEKAAALANENLGDWTLRWRGALAECHLPQTLELETAETALQHLQEIADILAEINGDLADRCTEMERAQDAFDNEAAACCRRLLPGQSDLSANDATAKLLATLAEAQQTASAYQELAASLAAEQAEIDKAEGDLADLLAEIAPWREIAGVDEAAGIDALQAVAEQSDALDKLETALAAESAAFHEESDGVDLATMRRERENTPADIRTARQAALVIERREADAARDTASANLKAAELALKDATRGSGEFSEAADAEAASLEAVAEMSEIAESYINQTLLARTLRWAIDRYANENQSPLLQTAERLFAILTVGRYVRLLTDIDRDPPELMVQPEDSAPVPIDGLSDGTRDQLFLALRLAGLSQQTGARAPLPFVADDLFINFDDKRAAAGFQVLAEQATDSQILYLSHHDHLVEIAKATLGDNVNIINL